jgi:hypothetical protein
MHPIELVDYFQPIELVSKWLIFAIFILYDFHNTTRIDSKIE